MQSMHGHSPPLSSRRGADRSFSVKTRQNLSRLIRNNFGVTAMTQVDNLSRTSFMRLQTKGMAIKRSLNYLAAALKRLGLDDPAEIVTAASYSVVLSIGALKTMSLDETPVACGESGDHWQDAESKSANHGSGNAGTDRRGRRYSRG